jgi:integrase
MLTAAQIESIKAPPRGQKSYWDSKPAGLGLRVSQGGRKTWVLLYRKGRRGNSRWLTLGTYPPLSLKDARDLAIKRLAEVQKDDRDPAAEKQEEKEQFTFAQLAEKYLREYAAQFKRPKSVAEDTRIINKELLPQWGERKAKGITRQDVISLLEAIVERPAAVMANRVQALASKVFNFGIQKVKVDTNPVHKVGRFGRESSRGRALGADEIRRVWAAFESEPQVWRAIFELLILTGQRSSEVREMPWREVDFEESTWVIPGSRTKNGLAHVVPLVGEALEILMALPRAGDFVFPGQKEAKPFTASSLHNAIERITARSGVEFHVHDLRRTVITHLGKLGVNRTVMKKVLNHSEGKDVTAIYDRHSYDSEKRTALARWDRRLHEIVEGRAADKVVELRAS